MDISPFPCVNMDERPKGQSIEVEIGETDILIIKCVVFGQPTETVLFPIGREVKTDNYGRHYHSLDVKVKLKQEFESGDSHERAYGELKDRRNDIPN